MALRIAFEQHQQIHQQIQQKLKCLKRGISKYEIYFVSIINIIKSLIGRFNSVHSWGNFLDRELIQKRNIPQIIACPSARV